MGWGPNPVEDAAARAAAAEAQERLANRPLTPFERKLLDVLDDIREELQLARPVPLEAIVGTADCGLISVSQSTAADLLLEQLLDSDPTDLSLAIDAGATALSNSFPTLNEDFTRSGLEKFAECVIDAALKDTARRHADDAALPAAQDEGQDAAPEVGGGDQGRSPEPGNPAVDTSTP
jgi:hypothetical protein